MKKLLVTYDTVDAYGVRGETRFKFTADNAVANALLCGSSDDAAYKPWADLLEYMLLSAEMFCNRHYVMGSIKDICPAEKI